jgi:hypothetical protein
LNYDDFFKTVECKTLYRREYDTSVYSSWFDHYIKLAPLRMWLLIKLTIQVKTSSYQKNKLTWNDRNASIILFCLTLIYFCAELWLHGALVNTFGSGLLHIDNDEIERIEIIGKVFASAGFGLVFVKIIPYFYRFIWRFAIGFFIGWVFQSILLNIIIGQFSFEYKQDATYLQFFKAAAFSGSGSYLDTEAFKTPEEIRLTYAMMPSLGHDYLAENRSQITRQINQSPLVMSTIKMQPHDVAIPPHLQKSSDLFKSAYKNRTARIHNEKGIEAVIDTMSREDIEQWGKSAIISMFAIVVSLAVFLLNAMGVFGMIYRISQPHAYNQNKIASRINGLVIIISCSLFLMTAKGNLFHSVETIVYKASNFMYGSFGITPSLVSADKEMSSYHLSHAQKAITENKLTTPSTEAALLHAILAKWYDPNRDIDTIYYDVLESYKTLGAQSPESELNSRYQYLIDWKMLYLI